MRIVDAVEAALHAKSFTAGLEAEGELFLYRREDPNPAVFRTRSKTSVRVPAG